MTRAFILILALIAGPVFAEKPSSGITNVRGFNHTTSLDNSIGPRGHSGPWLKYEAAQVERDLTNAQRLSLNQVRVFVACSAWKADRSSPTAISSTSSMHSRGTMSASCSASSTNPAPPPPAPVGEK